MKKFIFGLCLLTLFIVCGYTTAFAEVGQMGFFGGINEGRRLPKTTETMLEKTNSKKNETTTSVYKEMIFLSGVPTTFEGMLTVKNSGSVDPAKDAGTYKVTYTVKAGASTAEDVDIDRTIVFNVNYRKEGAQIIKDYEVASWKEVLSTGDGAFEIDPNQSHFGISILEDKVAGVTYYKGDISMRAVYLGGEEKTVLETTGSLYGYDCVWSNTETHRLDSQIYRDDWQMQYQVRPSVSVNKSLQYSPNEPSAISFEGNYREVMSNKSGMQYTIFQQPHQFYGIPLEGGASIDSYSSFEQLIAPDTTFLKGHSAESDIKKLFAMEIISGEPKHYQPSQEITRAQLVSMLVKAIKLPVEIPDKKTTKTSKTKKDVTVNITFPDVSTDRSDYPYIMAAYKSGLAVGRGNGHFYADYAIQREEAIAILIRTLGLSSLGLDPTPTTPFADDAEISGWAKQELYAAYKLGLIRPDFNGNINPKENISKAEAAALVNLLIEYMRTGLQTDYTEHIVNYAK